MSLGSGLLAIVVLCLTPAGASAMCGDDPGDAAAVAADRAQVAAECDCAGATGHSAYVRCAVGVAIQRVQLGLLTPACRREVTRCASRAVCGRSGFVTCCRTRSGITRCTLKRSAGACTPPAGGSACVGAFSSCCDACGLGGCVTTTTTSSTTTSTAPPITTTTAPTTTTVVSTSTTTTSTTVGATSTTTVPPSTTVSTTSSISSTSTSTTVTTTSLGGLCLSVGSYCVADADCCSGQCRPNGTTTACVTGSTTTSLPLCRPADCDDGNPCTDDRCTALGCRHDPKTGFAAVRCLLNDLEPSACGALARPIQHRLDQAIRLVDKAESAKPKSAIRLVRKAARLLNRAALAADAAERRGALRHDCAEALKGILLTRAARLVGHR